MTDPKRVDGRCRGLVSYNTERNKRTLLGACRAPGAGCNITSHSAAKIKHVRTLLTAAASGTTTFFPAILLPLFPFFLLSPFFSLIYNTASLFNRVKRVSPLNWTLSAVLRKRYTLVRYSSRNIIGLFFFPVTLLYFFGAGVDVHNARTRSMG